MKKPILTLLIVLSILLPVPSWAARQFDGTNDSLQSASALDLPNTQDLLYAISWWMYVTTYANNDDLALEYGSGSGMGGTNNAFYIDPNKATDLFRVGLTGAGGLAQTVDFARPSAGAWHHYIVNVDLTPTTNSIVSIFVDAVDQTSLTRAGSGNFSGDIVADNVLNVGSRNNTSLFAAMYMADLALYTTINLTQGNADSLFGGTLPTSVQSGNLVYYWKMCGVDSPETATTGAINMTVNGAIQVAHPSAITASCESATLLQGRGMPMGALQ